MTSASPISLRVLFFASLTDVVGQECLDLELASNTTIADLRHSLGRTYPGLDQILSRCRAAKGQRFVSDDALLEDGDEVAFLPPVSGG